MSQTPDIDILRLESQIYDHSPHLRCEHEVLKQNRRRQLREQLQNSIVEVELEKLDMDTIIRNSDNLLEKSQNLNVLSGVEFHSEEFIPKQLQLSESSEDDCDYTRPLSVIKQMEYEERQMQLSKYFPQTQEQPVPTPDTLGQVSRFNDNDGKSWTVGRTVRKRRMSIIKQHKQNAKSFRGSKPDPAHGNEHNEDSSAPDTPLTLSIRLPEVIREHRKKLEISIDLGRIDLSRQILGSELRCFNEQPTTTYTTIEEIQAIENTTSSQQPQAQLPMTAALPATTVDETEDEKALSHLISEVLVEPNAVETWRATNAIDNINNNIADNYNADLTDLPCYQDSAVNDDKTTKRRKSSKKRSQGPPKKRGRKPGTKNCPKPQPFLYTDALENQPKSDLAKYVELFSNNCELPGSTTPAASSTMSQLVTSTTQHLDSSNEQPITYYIEGDWANGGNCQLISTGNGDAGQITHEDFNMTELVNYIDSSTTDVGNNVIARVLEGGNVVPVSVSLPSFSNVYTNNNSSNIIQLPTMKYVNAANNSHQFLSHAPQPFQCHTSATNMQISSMSLLPPPPAAHNCEGVLDLSKKSSRNHCSIDSTSNNFGRVENYDSSDYGPIDLSLKYKKQKNETVPQQQQQQQMTQEHIVIDDESDDNFIRRLIETSGIDFKPEDNRKPSYTCSPIRPVEHQVATDESFKAALDMPLLDMENSSQNVESLKQNIKGSNNLDLTTSLISGNSVFNNTIKFADQSSKELFERLLEVGDTVNLDCENHNDNSRISVNSLCETEGNPNSQVDGDLNSFMKLFDTNNDNSKEEFSVEAETGDVKKVDPPLQGNKMQLEIETKVEKVEDALKLNNCNDAVKSDDNDTMESCSEIYGQMEKTAEDTDFILDSSSSTSITNNNTAKQEKTEKFIENKEVVALEDINPEKYEIKESTDNKEVVLLNEIESNKKEIELKTSESLQDCFINEVNADSACHTNPDAIGCNDNKILKRNSKDAKERKVDIISVVHLDSFNWTKDADNAYIQRILSKVKPVETSAEKPFENHNDGNNNAKNAMKFESNDLTTQNKWNHRQEGETHDTELQAAGNVSKKEQTQDGHTKNISGHAASPSSEDLLFVDIEDFQNKSYDSSLAVDNEKDPLSSTLESIASSIADTMTVEYLNKSTASCYSPHRKESNIDLIEDETRGDDVNLKLSMPKLTSLEKSSQECDVSSLDIHHEMESDIENNDVLPELKLEVYDQDCLQLSNKNNNDVVSMEGSQESVNSNKTTSSRLPNENLSDVEDVKINNDNEQKKCCQLSNSSNNEIVMLESSQNIEKSKGADQVSVSPATQNLNEIVDVKRINDDLFTIIYDSQLSEESQNIKMSNVEVPPIQNLNDADAKYKNDENLFDCVVNDLQLSEESQDTKISNDIASSGSVKQESSNDVDAEKDKNECVCDYNHNNAENNGNSQISDKKNSKADMEESQDIEMSDVSSNPAAQNLNDADEVEMKDEIMCDCNDYDLQLSEESQDNKILNVDGLVKQNFNDVDDVKQDNDEAPSDCGNINKDETQKPNTKAVEESQNTAISKEDTSSPKKQNLNDVEATQDKDDDSIEGDVYLHLSDKTNNEDTKESQDIEISNVDFGFSSSKIQKQNLHDVNAKEDNDDGCDIDNEDDHNNAKSDKYLQLSHNTNNEVIKKSQDIKVSANVSSSPIKQNANVADASKYRHGSSITKNDELFPSLSMLEMELKLDDVCLDYDDEIEDDALSLATSCFNSPDEDGFSDSKIDEGESKTTDASQPIDTVKSSDSGIDAVVSTERISQSTAPQSSKNNDIPKEECYEKGGYFLRKFRIPKVSCAEVTADCSKSTSMGKNSKRKDAGQSDNNETSCKQKEQTTDSADGSLFRRFKIPKVSVETKPKCDKSPAVLCTELSIPLNSTGITTKKRHFENIMRTVHNDCSTEAETSQPALNSAACIASNTLHHLPPLTMTATPTTTFNIAPCQREADEIESDGYVAPPPAHLLAEYAKMGRGKFAGKGGEALNRGTPIQHIAKIFGVTCLPFLVDKCFELAACPFSHNFLDAALVKRRLELLPPADVNAAYKFMYNHKQLFRRYFLEFCKIYTNQKNSNKLLNMVYDCERRVECEPFLRSIFYSLVKCGFSKINACRHILARNRDESKSTIDTLVSLILESDWTVFSDHIERFSKIKHYTFRFKDLNQMAATVLDAKNSRLSQIFFHCLLIIEPEELGLIQQSPILLHFLKLIESGKMRP